MGKMLSSLSELNEETPSISQFIYDVLAQKVERWSLRVEVIGSSPIYITTGVCTAERSIGPFYDLIGYWDIIDADIIPSLDH